MVEGGVEMTIQIPEHCEAYHVGQDSTLAVRTSAIGVALQKNV
jgi:hypothetical protein